MVAVAGGVEGEDAAVDVAQRHRRVADGDEDAARVRPVQLHVHGVDDVVDRLASTETGYQVAHVAREQRERVDGDAVDAGRRRDAVHDTRLDCEAPQPQHGLVLEVGRVRVRDDLAEECSGRKLVAERDDERLARLRLLLGRHEPRELPDAQRPLLDDVRQRHLEDADRTDVVRRQFLFGIVGAARAIDAHMTVEDLRDDARPHAAHTRTARANDVVIDDLRQEAGDDGSRSDEYAGAGERTKRREREEDEEQKEDYDPQTSHHSSQRLAPAAAQVAAHVVVELLGDVLGVIPVDELHRAEVVRLEDLHGAIAAAERRLAAVADRRDPRRVLVDQPQDGAVIAVDARQRVVGVVGDGGDERDQRKHGGCMHGGAEDGEEGDVEKKLCHGEHGRAVTEEDEHEPRPYSTRRRVLADDDYRRVTPV